MNFVSKMCQKDFIPVTPMLGIAASQYGVQLGLVFDKWTIKLFNKKEELKRNIFRDVEDGSLPTKYDLTAWILGVIPIEINSYQVQKTVTSLLEYAMKNKEKSKKSIGLKAAKDVKLKKVPEFEISKPKNKGWVVENKYPQDNDNICPSCGFLIIKCPSCGFDLIKTDKE